MLMDLGLFNEAYHVAADSRDPELQSELAQLVMKWVESDETVVTDLRTSSAGASVADLCGSNLIAHVKQLFIEPLVNEQNDAEDELEKFKWAEAFSGDGRKLLDWLNKLSLSICIQVLWLKSPTLYYTYFVRF